jgi:hypothetical protein
MRQCQGIQNSKTPLQSNLSHPEKKRTQKKTCERRQNILHPQQEYKKETYHYTVHIIIWVHVQQQTDGNHQVLVHASALGLGHR